ncbi:MAG: hypothetical protein QXX17_03760 [Conexivisphaerales archaeon]
MVWVKICGITRKEDLQAAADAGADAVGLITGIPESPRNLSEDRITLLAEYARKTTNLVLVARAEYVESNIDLIRKIQPWAVQVYGELSRRHLFDTDNIKLIKCVGSYTECLPPKFDDCYAVMVDTHDHFHSAGRAAIDVELCKRIKSIVHPKPIIVAGGLNPSNVRDVIASVRPFGVDASSGLEINPGLKDREKMKEFVKNAKGG